MPEMTEVRELFVDELQDAFFVEKTLVKTLPQLAQEAADAELAAAFKAHLQETREHVARLEKVFAAIGEKPKAKECLGIEGLKKEHDEFMSEEDPSAEIADIFLTGAGARTEHYEIAAYTGLIAMAKALGETEAASLLEENLRQEKEALKLVEGIGKRLTKASARRAVAA